MSNPTMQIRGIARYPWLNKPDTKFNDRGVFKTDLELEPEVAGPILEILEKMQAAEFARAKKERKGKKVKEADLPIQPKLDEEGEETGTFILKTSTYASGKSKKTGEHWNRKLPLFDGAGKPTHVRIGSGSEIIISVSVAAWTNAKGEVGVKFYLEAVQVIRVVAGSGASADKFGFGAVEGAYTSDEATDDDVGSEEDDEGEEDEGDEQSYDFS